MSNVLTATQNTTIIHGDNLQKDKAQISHTDSMKNKCIECHNPDQSPEWYDKRPNGIPGELNQGTLNKKFKEISCPKRLD